MAGEEEAGGGGHQNSRRGRKAAASIKGFGGRQEAASRFAATAAEPA
jgi:hypothetical protein